MLFTALIVVSLLGDGKPELEEFPLALHRSMEIDDLDREIQKIHDAVLMKRAQFATSQRLAQRGLVSRGDLQRETSDLRYQEAREAETMAYRAIKVYERDVLSKVIPADDQKAFTLLLDWVRGQLSIAQVDVDYRTYALTETRALWKRNAVSRQEFDDAELALIMSQASVALSRSREAQVLMGISLRNGEKPSDPVDYRRLKTEFLKTRVRYYELTEGGARRRLEIARERSRLGQLPPNEIALFEHAATEAATALANERKALEQHESETSAPPTKPTTGRDASRPAEDREKVPS
jgi:hypothetical protein